ncbi:DUF3348 domain-containing protein [Paraburkholderia fungorum]|uniref:DUF3348 domain-containing protein n=1 Tax=Paraburkholderia fungorum TaxID=134537 RepID=UPI0038B76574
MVQAPQRTAFSGPTLIRLLARLADADVAESRESLSDRLSQWLGWTDAIALSSALNGSPRGGHPRGGQPRGGQPRGGRPSVVTAGARADGHPEEAECARVRASLAHAITGDSVSAGARRRGAAQPAPQVDATDGAVDYALFRQRYLSMQQSMETAIGNLRGRLRSMLATRTPAMTQLAVLDAVMERALNSREQSLLASVPVLLAGHFERLREAAQAALAEAEANANADVNADANPDAAGGAAKVKPGAWLDVFRKDMQSVLLAELELRFQPVEGLLAALRTR